MHTSNFNQFVCHICTTDEMYHAIIEQVEVQKSLDKNYKPMFEFLRFDAEDSRFVWLQVTISSPTDIQTLFHSGVKVGWDTGRKKMEEIYQPLFNSIFSKSKTTSDEK
jgi:hypothetical protein